MVKKTPQTEKEKLPATICMAFDCFFGAENGARGLAGESMTATYTLPPGAVAPSLRGTKVAGPSQNPR